MPDPLATSDDVARALLRPLTSNEELFIDGLLEEASAMLRQATKQTIDTRIGLFTTAPTDPRALDPKLAAKATATIIKRFLSNPNGVVSTSESSGPYSTSYAYALRGDKDIRGEMIVTDQDIELLAVEVPAQVGSIHVGGSPLASAGMWTTMHTPGQVYDRYTDAMYAPNPGVVLSEIPDEASS